MPKLFGQLKARYADRPGGYTRVLRTEPKKDDQAQSAILELVDGPYDMRFAMTAAAVARDRTLGRDHSELTQRNRNKVVRYRKEGEHDFELMVRRTQKLRLGEAGTQLADMEPVISQRLPKADEELKRAKPTHDYWSPGKSSGPTGRRKTPKALTEKIGDPENQAPSPPL